MTRRLLVGGPLHGAVRDLPDGHDALIDGHEYHRQTITGTDPDDTSWVADVYTHQTVQRNDFGPLAFAAMLRHVPSASEQLISRVRIIQHPPRR